MRSHGGVVAQGGRVTVWLRLGAPPPTMCGCGWGVVLGLLAAFHLPGGPLGRCGSSLGVCIPGFKVLPLQIYGHKDLLVKLGKLWLKRNWTFEVKCHVYSATRSGRMSLNYWIHMAVGWARGKAKTLLNSIIEIHFWTIHWTWSRSSLLKNMWLGFLTLTKDVKVTIPIPSSLED